MPHKDVLCYSLPLSMYRIESLRCPLIHPFSSCINRHVHCDIVINPTVESTSLLSYYYHM